MTRRVLAVGVALLAAAAVVVLGTGAGGGGGHYRVRAIFTNAFTVIKGEDVKIAGVKVGRISGLEVTRDDQAAVILDITRPGFQDFRTDATCTIRPQSLIGERFVECTPTQPRAAGAAPAPRLRRIEHGDGAGQYLLPASQTVKPVDLDLVANIMRLPYRQRLSIIVNELGTGLAGNGDQLRRAVRAADPALRQTDRVLAILARQNRVLADLARHSDQVLAPLARQRAHVADFVVKADTTARATAERRSDLERNLERLPTFLRELKPTMRRLGGLSDQLTPIATDLGRAAPEVNRVVEGLGPFSAAATPALTSLGDAADTGDEALLKSRPLIGDLGTFATQAKPLAHNLDALLSSLRDTGGVERLMDLLYYGVASTNGFDAVGHYLRAVLLITTCSTYITRGPSTGCSSKFSAGGSAARASGAAAVPAAAPATPQAASAAVRSTAAAPARSAAAAPTRASSASAGPLLDYLLGG